MRRYLLPKDGHFYKANLHCHSTISDGKLSPEQIKKVYMERGYSIVAYTDHDILIPHNDLTDSSFLALNGYEMEVNERLPEGVPSNRRKVCHMCLIALDEATTRQACWHREKYLFGNAVQYRDQADFDPALPDYEREYTPACVSDMMQKGRDGGFFVTYNHPAWSLETARNYADYRGMHAMEICNFGCYEIGWEDYVPYIYDEMLRDGKRIFCIGADDNHNHGENWAHDSFGAFTVIKAEALSYRAVTDAMLRGDLYASQGPEILELYVEDGTVHIKSSPARRITIGSGVRYADAVWAKEGETITEAAFTYPANLDYFRLTVYDEQGRPANTRAYFLDEL